MKTLTLSIISALLCASAFARIGETDKQIEARYGKPTWKEAAPFARRRGIPGSTEFYQAAGIKIVVTFIDGISESESYTKVSGEKLESSEVETILAANAGQKKWLKVEAGHPFYTTGNDRWLLGEISPDATLADFDLLNGHLLICSKKFFDASHAASKAAADAKLKGF